MTTYYTYPEPTPGWSEQFTESFGDSTSRSHSLAVSISRGKSRSLTRSRNWNRGSGRTLSAGTSGQTGEQESAGSSENAGVTKNRSWSDGQSDQRGRSGGRSVAHQKTDSSGAQEQENAGRSTLPDGSTLQRQLRGGKGTNRGHSQSDTEISQEQATSSHGTSHQEGGSEAATASRGTSRQRGRNWNSGWNKGVADQETQSKGGGTAATEGEQETASLSRTLTVGGTNSHQQGESRGRQGSAGLSESQSSVPFHRMEEFQEGQESFWSHQEIAYLRTGQLKEQPVGTAVMKLGATAPVTVRVDLLRESPHRGEATREAVSAFGNRVAAAWPDFYATPAEIQREITDRQTAIFGEVMRLNLTAAPIAPAAPQSSAPQLLPPGLPGAAGTASAPPPASGQFSDDD